MNRSLLLAGAGRFIAALTGSLFVAPGAGDASAQIVPDCFAVPGFERDTERRALELDGGGTIGLWQSPSGVTSARSRLCGTPGPENDGVRITPIPSTVSFTYLSGLPSSRNDGATWAGRGASTSLSGGMILEVGPLSATLRPSFFIAANRDFEIDTVRTANRSEFAYPYLNSRIDLPQRFGNETVSHLDWGQSELRLRVGALTLALSQENIWWGPAHRNPILMSTSAGGFPHVDFGTDGMAETPIGGLEVRTFWGELTESDYFDFDADNDRRLLVGLLFGWQPKWVPGLTVGAARTFYRTWTDSLAFGDYWPLLQSVFKNDLTSPTNPSGNDEADQLLSLYGRWLLRESRFEVYLEWSRNDHSASLRDFFLQPDHSRAYTLGFSKLFGATDSPVRLLVESSTLGRPLTRLVRPTPPYYIHHRVRQGYTHNGQILGASIGPGANAQLVRVDKWMSWGRLTWYFERVRFNDDEHFPTATTFTGGLFRRNDAAFTLGTSGQVRVQQQFDLDFGLAFGRELNRYYIFENDVTNVSLDLALTWRPGR